MLLISPIILLLFTASAILILPRLRPGFSSHWLLAVGGAFSAWVALLMQQSRLPLSVVLATWRPTELFTGSPQLLVDDISWFLAVALATLGLSVILVDVRRSANADSSEWAFALALVALGILAVYSGNWLTLGFALILIDASVLIMLWLRTPDDMSRRRLLAGFSANLIAVAILISGMVLLEPGWITVDGFATSTSLTNLLFIFAIGIRLGIAIAGIGQESINSLNRNLGTLVQFVPAAATLTIIVRITLNSPPNLTSRYLIVISMLAAVYGAVRWARAKESLQGRPFWIFALVFLALAAALQEHPGAALALGSILLYGGAFLSLTYQESRRTLPPAILLFFAVSTLPFSPTFVIAEAVAASSQSIQFGLLFSYALILFGIIRHVLAFERKHIGFERWVELIYYLGVALLPLTFIGVNVWVNTQANLELGLLLWRPAVLSLGSAAIISLLVWRGVRIPSILISATEIVFSFRWLLRLIERGTRGLERLTKLLNALLEGEGGMLWALLLVALLVSFLVQFRAGG